jgi:SWI/SNF-related matrix-associated actin-dependent regulator of chromatin subfamily A member 5
VLNFCSITDADIDDLIAKGESETKAMNEKLEDFAENARKFTMDGGMLNDYKDENEEEGTIDGPNLKAIMSTNWVDPPKRERKRVNNYNESEYYRQV